MCKMQLSTYKNLRRKSAGQSPCERSPMELTEDSVVLCTVKKIEKTTIFLDIEDNGEGSMVFSEVAAGRIRNLREYVFPSKKIVCKILSTEPGNIQLSLRRVTAKERDEVLERYKKEKRLHGMLKSIAKKPEEIIKKIKEEHDLLTFLEDARDKPEILKKFFSKEGAEKFYNLLKEKIIREKEVKKAFKLSSESPEGIQEIKEILSIRDVEIRYLGSSIFSITAKAKDFKEANKKISSALETIEKKAKENHAHFEIKER